MPACQETGIFLNDILKSIYLFAGAFGDVDGDGELDVIVNLVSVGVLRDEYANFVKMKFDTDEEDLV